MKTFTLGVLIAVLGFVAYPKRQAILCLAFPGHKSCQPVVVEPIAIEPAPKKTQKVFKWTDEQGVVHYGEKDLGGAVRIDESLKEITVISGSQQAMARNQSATSDLRRSGAASSFLQYNVNKTTSTSANSREAKKKRCAYLASKRDGYSMKSTKYKQYSTQYSQECIL